MQSNATRSLFSDPDNDDRFLEMIQDSSKRQERLKRLEQSRTLNKWLLFTFWALAITMSLGALTSSNPSLFSYLIALFIAMAAWAAVQQSAADAKIKMIKLYALLAQGTNRAA